MLLQASPPGQARVAGLRQHPGLRPGDVAGRAAADLAGLAAGRGEAGLVLSAALAGVWTAPAAARVRVMPPGQPSTDVWWGLVDELAGDAGQPGLVVAADYDPGLGYLCLTAFDTGVAERAG
jgi:4-hydroxymandelate oxidase